MPLRQTSSSICTTAASQGAPQAIQTADRFHLCKNLTEAVEKTLARCRAEIRKKQKAKKKPPATISSEEPAPPMLTTDGKPYSAHQAERYDRYQQVVALREQGVKIKEIARRLGLGTRTIQGWLKAGAYVETNYHHRHRSRFDAYEAYVRQRLSEGCHNIQQIWREIKAQGYPHSDRAFRAHLEAVRGKKPAALEDTGVLDHFSAKKAVWLFVRPFDDLSEIEQEELRALRQASTTAETIYHLVQEFFRLVRTRQGTQLDPWLSKVQASAIPELQRFANGLERDKAAVLAGLTLIHSNGQTEGQVTRIKRDFAHDVWSGGMCEARVSRCSMLSSQKCIGGRLLFLTTEHYPEKTRKAPETRPNTPRRPCPLSSRSRQPRRFSQAGQSQLRQRDRGHQVLARSASTALDQSLSDLHLLGHISETLVGRAHRQEKGQTRRRLFPSRSQLLVQ